MSFRRGDIGGTLLGRVLHSLREVWTSHPAGGSGIVMRWRRDGLMLLFFELHWAPRSRMNE